MPDNCHLIAGVLWTESGQPDDFQPVLTVNLGPKGPVEFVAVHGPWSRVKCELLVDQTDDDLQVLPLAEALAALREARRREGYYYTLPAAVAALERLSTGPQSQRIFVGLTWRST